MSPTLALFTLAATAPAPPQQLEGWHETVVEASEPGADLRLGYALAASGDRAIAGTPFVREAGWPCGGAFVFDYEPASERWLESARLVPSDPAVGAGFGEAIALQGDLALIGARADSAHGPDSGAAYFFSYDRVLDRWVERQKIHAPDAAAGDQFGGSVALSGDVAVVGAWSDDDGGTNSGSAYVLRFDHPSDTWLFEAKLLASNAEPQDAFGTAVAVVENTILVSAMHADGVRADTGAAYVSTYDPLTRTWRETSHLFASDGDAHDGFGSSVALCSGRALIGADFDDERGRLAGAAYVFRLGAAEIWIEEAKLLASDAQPFDSFGHSVALEDGRALVGGTGFDGARGGVRLFVLDPIRRTWRQVEKLAASDGQPADRLAESVALAGRHVLTCASLRDSPSGSDRGALYSFTPYLSASSVSYSLASGARIDFVLDFPSSEGGRAYALLASASGTEGVTLPGGVVLPLTLDPLLSSMLGGDPPPAFVDPSGTLDPRGNASTAAMPLPCACSAWVGRTLWFAAVSLDVSGATPTARQGTRLVTLVAVP